MGASIIRMVRRKSVMLCGMICLCIAYPFIVRTMPSDMRLEPIQRRKEYDSKRVGCAKGWMRRGYGRRDFFDGCISVVSAAFCPRERGHTWERMDLCCDRWKDGRKASLSLYILLC